MKFLIIQDYLRSGGTERQTLFLGRRVTAAGHALTLLTFRPGGPLAGAPLTFSHRSLQRRYLKLDWFAPGLRRAAAAERPDAILCMGRMANSYAGGLQRRLPKIPVIATLRTGKALPWLFRRSLGSVRHIVANSRYALERHCAGNPDLLRKATVIYNPLLFQETAGSPPVQELVLLNCAMFRPEKNQAELITLCAGLPAELPWRLWLVGAGPRERACRRLVRRLGLQERVTFWGFQADPAPFYRRATLAVSASLRESLPNFIIEAQAAGLPVAAYRAGGTAECLLPGQSGLLADCGDAVSFADNLNRLLTDASLRHEFSQAAARFARDRFNPEQRAAEYVRVLERLATDLQAG